MWRWLETPYEFDRSINTGNGEYTFIKRSEGHDVRRIGTISIQTCLELSSTGPWENDWTRTLARNLRNLSLCSRPKASSTGLQISARRRSQIPRRRKGLERDSVALEAYVWTEITPLHTLTLYNAMPNDGKDQTFLSRPSASRWCTKELRPKP